MGHISRETDADAVLIRLEDAISNIDYPGADSTEWIYKAKAAARVLRSLVQPAASYVPPLPTTEEIRNAYAADSQFL